MDWSRLFSAAWLAVLAIAGMAPAEPHWPSWRGPDGTGVAPGNPPVTWSESENILWKVPLAGTGQSTPVVWGDRIYLLEAASAEESAQPTVRPDASDQPRGQGRRLTLEKPEAAFNFNVVCIDRATGATVWTRTVATATPHEGHHRAGSFAAYSAVTDGEMVWAGFGSRGVYGLDRTGNVVWGQPQDPMTMKSNFGEGSSVALVGDCIVAVQDHEGPSKIRAYDKRTGELRWERDRDETTSWSTPVGVEVDGAWQVVTNAGNRIRAYDAVTGELVWACGGMTQNVIPTPVVGHGRVYCASGFFGSAMRAIALGHSGDLTDSPAVAWRLDEATPYVPTPLLYGDRLYLVEDIKPYLSCVDAHTGRLIYTGQRLEGLRQTYASPAGAAGRIYVPDRSGKTAVVAHGDAFELLAVNSLEDGFDASPVIVGDTILLKGNRFLYCIGAAGGSGGG
ncbi:MAG: PQQ-binding-like beta-propeller repeat protein [Candidatus Hydrogenedentes bacterium]|nr:PQQ-binding-like beta-propeller repeat protein [Candidatus Hydrogenedentota bacterium]